MTRVPMAQFVSLLSNGAVEPSAEVMRTATLGRMTRAEAAPILARLRPESARAVFYPASDALFRCIV